MSAFWWNPDWLSQKQCEHKLFGILIIYIIYVNLNSYSLPTPQVKHWSDTLWCIFFLNVAEKLCANLPYNAFETLASFSSVGISFSVLSIIKSDKLSILQRLVSLDLIICSFENYLSALLL